MVSARGVIGIEFYFFTSASRQRAFCVKIASNDCIKGGSKNSDFNILISEFLEPPLKYNW